MEIEAGVYVNEKQVWFLKLYKNISKNEIEIYISFSAR
jgi:hypothetical protein